VWVLASYYAAQCLIVWGLIRSHAGELEWASLRLRQDLRRN
jgi:hypothetical protein